MTEEQPGLLLRFVVSEGSRVQCPEGVHFLRAASDYSSCLYRLLIVVAVLEASVLARSASAPSVLAATARVHPSDDRQLAAAPPRAEELELLVPTTRPSPVRAPRLQVRKIETELGQF